MNVNAECELIRKICCDNAIPTIKRATIIQKCLLRQNGGGLDVLGGLDNNSSTSERSFTANLPGKATRVSLHRERLQYVKQLPVC
jgi:hypothetical protein